MGTALTASRGAKLPQTVAARFPWLAATGAPALNPLPGSHTHRRERPGPSGDLVPAGRPRAARRRPVHLAGSARHLHPLRRGAVTGASNRAGKDPRGPQTPSRVDGDPAAQSHEVCGSGAARHADLHASSAVSAPHPASAARTTTPVSSTAPTADLTAAPHSALAPGLSPQPSRLTPSAPSARPVDPAHQGQDRAARPGAQGDRSDAARIATPCSAPATPAATVSAAQGDATASYPSRAPKPSTTAARVAHLPAKRVGNEGASHTDLHSGLSAVSALSVGEGQVMFHPLQER